MFTNRQLKFLRYIRNPQSIKNILSRFNFKDYNDINSLFDDPVLYISYSDNKFDSDTIVTITNLGRSEIEAHDRNTFHFWTPVIISILALIGAYRAELAQLIQAITKLLKLQ